MQSKSVIILGLILILVMIFFMYKSVHVSEHMDNKKLGLIIGGTALGTGAATAAGLNKLANIGTSAMQKDASWLAGAEWSKAQSAIKATPFFEKVKLGAAQVSKNIGEYIAALKAWRAAVR